MGRWYVIASIPTFLERGAHNAVETYRRDADGTIATTFTFRRRLRRQARRVRPRRLRERAESPAVWGMQFVWPIKAEYRIVYLDPDYSQTVIGRSARDYVWIMARTPEIPDEEYEQFLALVRELDYDVAKLERVPHRWT